MARKSDGEKIDDLIRQVTTLEERIDGTRGNVTAIVSAQRSVVQILNGLETKAAVVEERLGDWKKLKEDVADLKTTIALLQREWEDVKKHLEEGSKRRWAILPPVAGAIINVLLSALVAYRSREDDTSPVQARVNC
jgi:SMC interacting uncharacterized protein involved in chromosome segregation